MGSVERKRKILDNPKQDNQKPDSQQVKQNLISSLTNLAYDLPNDLRLKI